MQNKVIKALLVFTLSIVFWQLIPETEAEAACEVYIEEIDEMFSSDYDYYVVSMNVISSGNNYSILFSNGPIIFYPETSHVGCFCALDEFESYSFTVDNDGDFEVQESSFSNIIYGSYLATDYSFFSNTSIKDAENLGGGNFKIYDTYFFCIPLQKRLIQEVSQMDLKAVMNQVAGLVPLLIGFLITLISFSKGLRMLWQVLRKA